MSQKQRHKPFSKEDFERALKDTSLFSEYPAKWYDILWTQDKDGHYSSEKIPGTINEYCYMIPLFFEPKRLIKVYSSVLKATNISRKVGGDAIRVVLADFSGEPKHESLTRINRTENWEWNLRKRISEILNIEGFHTHCPKCGHVLFMRWGRKSKKRFLGCSKWPDCEGVRNSTKLNEGLRNQ